MSTDYGLSAEATMLENAVRLCEAKAIRRLIERGLAGKLSRRV